MEISRVSQIQPAYISQTNKIIQKNNYKISDKNNFQPVFKGYERVLQQSVKTILDNDTQVEKTFNNLLNAVLEKQNINKANGYYDIINVYNKRGFRGLLYELWKSEPQQKLKKFLNNETVDIITENNKPLFQIVSFGKLGFSKDSPNDVKIVFINPKNNISMQYGLNKKGELDIWQTGEDQTVITKFHLITGNRKCVVEQYKGANPEITYYNKDGSKAFFKNLFRGGVAIPQ